MSFLTMPSWFFPAVEFLDFMWRPIYPPGFSGAATLLQENTGIKEDDAYLTVRFAYRGFQYGSYMAPVAFSLMHYYRGLGRRSRRPVDLRGLYRSFAVSSAIGPVVGAATGYATATRLSQQDLALSVEKWKQDHRGNARDAIDSLGIRSAVITGLFFSAVNTLTRGAPMPPSGLLSLPALGVTLMASNVILLQPFGVDIVGVQQRCGSLIGFMARFLHHKREEEQRRNEQARGKEVLALQRMFDEVAMGRLGYEGEEVVVQRQKVGEGEKGLDR